MCGFYSRAELTSADFKKLYAVSKVQNATLAPKYNIRPTTTNLVVTRNSPNKAELMTWYFLPDWDGFPYDRGVTNVRIESLKEGKNFFKKSFYHHRCLIPASSWIEWKEIRGVKIPHVFKLSQRKFFAFAGLWSEYTDKNGERVKGYAIITGLPNSLAAGIHDRQPCVLQKEDENTWIDPEAQDEVSLFKCLDVYPESDMEIYPVRRDLSENSPDILRRMNENELEAELNKKSSSKRKRPQHESLF